MMRLDVLTYNIHKGLTAGNRRYALHRMREALARRGPDLVLLQEIVGTHTGHALRFAQWSAVPQTAFLAEDDWQHAVYGRSAVHALGDHGNAILSKLPITDWQNIDVSVSRWEQRAILHALIRTVKDSPPLHVCCVHLNLRQSDRRRQLERLVDHLRETVPPTAPLIVGGDFNDWRLQAGDVLADAVGVVDVYQTLHGRHARTFPAWRPLLALDRIYCRGLGIEAAEVMHGGHWQGMSDHLALSARLTLPAPGQDSGGFAHCAAD